MSKNNNNNTAASIKSLKEMTNNTADQKKKEEPAISNATINPKKEVAPFTDKAVIIKNETPAPAIVTENSQEAPKTVVAAPKKKKFNICPMGAVDVKNENLYKGKGFGFIRKITGRVFLYNGVNYNGFYKVCKNVNDCSNQDENVVIGYIAADVVEN